MAARTQALFLEDSDSEGSINTTTTAESQDSDKEYNIELILAETPNTAGALQYLIKWEGYPLYQATWEPADKFTEYEDLLRTWEAEKEAARRPGGKALFEVDEYREAVELEEERRRLKKRKRRLMRQRRGEYVPSEGEEDEDGDELPTTEAPKSTRAKAPLASPTTGKSKGVATRVDGGGKRVALTDLTGEQDDDADSLFGEPRYQLNPTGRRSSVASLTSPRRISAPSTSARRPSEPTNRASASIASGATTAAYAAQPTPNAIRKSVSSAPVATAKRTKNVFASDWTAEKKRRMKTTVSGDTPKNSSDPKFRNLSEQNRYQKYGRHNEPAPDLNALSIVDPKTGRVQKPAEPTRKNTDIDRVYARRSSPRRGRQRARSSSPPIRQPTRDAALSKPADDRKGITCKDWRYGTCQYTAETCPYAHADVQKTVTCFYWRKGDSCKLTAEQCAFAHHDTGTYAGPPGTFFDDPKSNITCYFWMTNGDCKRRDRCRYAHKDTGAYAGPPGTREVTYREDQAYRAPVMAGDVEPMMSGTVEADAVRGAPALPVNHVAEAPALQLNTSVQPTPPTPSIPTPYGNTPSPTRDPRLRGRPSIGGKPVMPSPAEPIYPPLTPGNDSDAVMIDTPADIMTREQNILVQDPLVQEAEIAERAVPQLDFIPFIQTKEGNLVGQVFLQIPEGRSTEMKVLKDRLKEWNCNVFSSRTRGQWEFFKGNKECLVIVHPSENFCGTMPGLHNFLMKGSAISVFSIGVQHARCISEGREPAYEAHRVFPMGGITFITDDVFVYYPEKATEIIERFYTIAKGKGPGREYGKIGARPGIKDWLLRLANQRFDEEDCADEERDLRWIKAYDAICRLCPIPDEDPRYLPDRSVPLERSWLWSHDETHFPSFEGRWERGDEEGATDYMVEFFAGEAVCSVGKYRRFVVVYQRPGEEKTDPRGWMDKYSHIGVVTPDKYLASNKK